MSVIEQLDAVFAPWDRTDAPGLTVGIVKDGEVMYHRGFGMASLESGIANTPKTRMRIGSISKHFTSLLALLLAEEGKLDLDVPIRTYVPELVDPGGDPSLRLLLQHRGGSRCYLDIGFLCHGMALSPVGAALAMQMRQRGRNFAPGEAMIYNNGGYHLVSIAIERVGNLPFEVQLKQRLFDPVGMFDTVSIPTDYEITPGIATMHVPLPNGGWRRGLFPSEEIRGEGAIVSTIDDMLRWTVHLNNRNRFGSPAMWAQLTERPTFLDGTTGIYALGLILRSYRGAPTISHSGGVIGGSSQMLIFPEHRLAIVILVNGAPEADPTRLAERVADIVLAGYLHEPAPAIPAASHQELIGDWWSPDTGMRYSLVAEDGALKLSLDGGLFGQALERLPDGRVVSLSSSAGTIEVELDRGHIGNLVFRFGGYSAAYRKVAKEKAENSLFPQAAIGQYYSDDADCTASIACQGESLRITFTDLHGRVETLLHPFNEMSAAIEPFSPLFPFYSALTLMAHDAGIIGFRINTGRTRNLVFTRVPPNVVAGEGECL